MNCKEFGNIVHELVSGRLADKTKQLEALEHAGHCLWCARRLDDESKLTERLHAYAATVLGQRAPLRVESELLQAFRERKLGEGTPLLRGAGRRIWHGLGWGLAIAAMAAAALIMIIEWPRFHHGMIVGPSHVAVSRPQFSSDAARGNLSSSSAAAGAALKSAGRPGIVRALNSQGSAPEESEATTDFISLGTCDDSQCMEEATLVRVALPAEALLAFGLGTGNEDAPDAVVQADVALGSNGVPFAIRFVN